MNKDLNQLAKDIKETILATLTKNEITELVMDSNEDVLGEILEGWCETNFDCSESELREKMEQVDKLTEEVESYKSLLRGFKTLLDGIQG